MRSIIGLKGIHGGKGGLGCLLVVLLCVVAAAVVWYLCRQSPELTTATQPVSAGAYRSYILGGLPKAVSPQSAFKLLQNKGYLCGYSENRKDPLWVAYRLFKVDNPPKYPRPPRFQTDGRTEAKVRHEDYTGSGYDRGHMAPNYAIGTRYGTDAQLETFLMSNICPQLHRLNAGVWEKIEDKEANDWANRFREVWVIAGPIFDAKDRKLPCGVEVPDAFYRIEVDNDAGTLGMLAFIVPHGVASRERMEQFLTTVNEVEKETGLDFFTEFGHELERRLESEKAEKVW